MVSFSCEVCNDTVIKRKLAQHQRQCRGAYFTCIDCNTTFYNNEHNAHTSCISEAEKYEKALYKGKKTKNNNNNKQPQKKEQPKTEEKKVTEEKKKDVAKSEKTNMKSTSKLNLSKYLKKGDSISLYKVFKSIKKDNKEIKDKTDLLKLLKVSMKDDGSITILL